MHDTGGGVINTLFDGVASAKNMTNGYWVLNCKTDFRMVCS